MNRPYSEVNEMSKTFDFIRECGVFYVLTAQDNAPFGRPFGAIMEYKDKLYLSTGNKKQVYRQIRENENVQLLAMNAFTGSWIRVSGTAVETEELSLKQKMLEECPVLKHHFPSADAAHFALIEFTVTQTEIQ